MPLGNIVSQYSLAKRARMKYSTWTRSEYSENQDENQDENPSEHPLRPGTGWVESERVRRMLIDQIGLDHWTLARRISVSGPSLYTPRMSAMTET
jgi:hypothetical protein